MKLKLLTLRYAASLSGFDDRPLVEFTRDKVLLQVREHFFVVHEVPHLACLVLYEFPGRADGQVEDPPPEKGRKGAKVPPLTEEERILFENLREWRLDRARADGVPPYVILTNRELAGVVQSRPATPNALQAIPGIGPGKVERYGAEILQRLGGNGEVSE